MGGVQQGHRRRGTAGRPAVVSGLAGPRGAFIFPFGPSGSARADGCWLAFPGARCQALGGGDGIPIALLPQGKNPPWLARGNKGPRMIKRCEGPGSSCGWSFGRPQFGGGQLQGEGRNTAAPQGLRPFFPQPGIVPGRGRVGQAGR